MSQATAALGHRKPKDDILADHHLDADPSKWPQDPFALLGVSRGDDERTVRRAYLKLIKIFKPEISPDEFQLIRRAFEAVSMMRPSRSEDTLDAPAPIVIRTESGEEVSIPVAQRVPVSIDQSSPPEHDSTASIWDELCRTGDDAAAYQKLVRLDELSPADPRVCVRLYWLLHLHPELDSSKHRLWWLTRGLAVSGPTSETALRLYLQEMQRDPYEARSLRCTDTLKLDLPINHRVSLLLERWIGCSRTGSLNAIIEDITQWREFFSFDHQELWAHLLTAAIRQFVAPVTTSGTVSRQQRSIQLRSWVTEITQLSRFAQEQVADEIDFLMMLAQEWDGLLENMMFQMAPEWLHVIAASVTNSTLHQAFALRVMLPPLVKDPISFLMTFDSLMNSCPAAAIQAGRAILDFCEAATRSPRTMWEAEVKDVERRLRREFYSGDYFLVRRGLLTISLEEDIALATLANAAQAMLPRPSHFPTWLDGVNRDLSLQAAYAACRYVFG